MHLFFLLTLLFFSTQSTLGIESSTFSQVLNTFIKFNSLPKTELLTLIENKGDNFIYYQNMLVDIYPTQSFIHLSKNLPIETFLVFHHSTQHDQILKDLHQLLGPHSSFQTHNSKAIHTWKLQDRVLWYASTCTITCFPIYLYTTLKNLPAKTTPIIERLLQNKNKLKGKLLE